MNIALILSGGTGTRLGGDIPKQYIEVNNKMIIEYCLESIAASERIDAIQIVAEDSYRAAVMERMKNSRCGEILRKFRGFSLPGANRQLSIYNGMRDILSYSEATDNVFIHDAARPGLTHSLIDACFDSLSGHDGVIPVIPVKDTLYMSEDGKRISSLLDRSRIFAGQAPECFVLGRYFAANESLLPDRILAINGSTEVAVMAGLDVVMVAGDENNYKITTRADLERFISGLGRLPLL